MCLYKICRSKISVYGKYGHEMVENVPELPSWKPCKEVSFFSCVFASLSHLAIWNRCPEYVLVGTIRDVEFSIVWGHDYIVHCACHTKDWVHSDTWCVSVTLVTSPYDQNRTSKQLCRNFRPVLYTSSHFKWEEVNVGIVLFSCNLHQIVKLRHTLLHVSF